MEGTTLRQLAERLGLGKSTVQRALAGSGRVAAATRARVEAAAREANFEHDVYFSSLSAKRRMKGKSRVLLHYLFGGGESTKSVAGLNIHMELREAGASMGYDVIPVAPSEYPKLEVIPRILFQRGSKGLIVGLTNPRLHRPLLELEKLPIVCCQRQQGLPFHTVRFGVADRMRLCWSKLWEAGYRRIGCAVMSHDRIIDDDRDRLGAALALNAEFLEPEQCIPPLTGGISDYAAFREWLEAYQPEAVVGFSPGHWYLMRDAGWTIPYVCLHAALDGASAQIPGSLQPRGVLARAVLREMDSMIRHGEVGRPAEPVHVVISPRWHEGTRFNHGLSSPGEQMAGINTVPSGAQIGNS